MQIGVLKLAGLQTEQCAATLAGALKAVKGVNAVEVSFKNSKATVKFDEALVSPQRLQVVVEDTGFQIAKPVHGEDGACCGGCGGCFALARPRHQHDRSPPQSGRQRPAGTLRVVYRRPRLYRLSRYRMWCPIA